MEEQEVEVAVVEDYYSHVGVVALKVTSGSISVGDILHFKGHTTDLIQEISSMQIDRMPVKSARSGDSVGIKVNDRVRMHDRVFKVLPEE